MGSYGQHSAATAAAGVTTADAYTAIALSPTCGVDGNTSAFRVTGGGPTGIVVWNTHGANSIDCKLQANNDPTLAATWADLTTTELTGIATASAKAYQLQATGYLFLRVVAKATSAGNQGTVNFIINQNSVS